jgi:murein DD-endopeptidase MepM/ murein hydrolase activator NlpD
VLPILHYRLTAGFGEVGLWSHAHTGQDLAAPTGTPVRAVGDGTVIFAAWDGAYGNKIAIQHPDGTVTWYAHLSAYVVRSGKVKAGQLIGKVGSTGNTTGPHLHFEVRPHNGGPIPPLAWLTAHGIKY